MKHLSDINKLQRCDRLLWLSKKQPQAFQRYVMFNENIYELTLRLFGMKEYFKGAPHDTNERFFSNIDAYDVFVSVRLEYNDLRIKMPIMRKVHDGFVLYYPYANCYPKEHEAQTYADQEWVLDHLGIRVVDRFIVRLNPEYVRQGELDLEQLLLVEKKLYNDKNKAKHSIGKLVNERKRDLTPFLEAIDTVMEEEPERKIRTNICTRKGKCEYFDVCFPNQKDVSILNLVSSSKKFELHDIQGIETISQIDFADVEGTRHQYAQYMAAKTGTLFFDAVAVSHFFRDVTYPISYLDFEWETFAFPPFDGMKPYDVLTFQYSLHIEDAKHNVRHKEFLGRKDCREDFIKQLIEDIPKTGSVMCFNVEGAEKLRLKQLAAQFPKYHDALEQIWQRMVDLAIPFSSGLIYDNKMAGMYSLKKLVKIFTNKSYDELAIGDGITAMQSYAKLDEADEETIKNLLKYCAMDTYSMILVYHWVLRQLAKRKKNK
ncbi:uncharacterized protein DUF2779 [Breznakia blatticola]|uniref:Uncharacterized protein DUF2779 n=1 Tax=Breznakia blatticola TaxID=1754012 RepID=A0A4R7ZUZ7_9FIRM|nr:DUF2779 domain-containing protein [Breznakia blatticola]TDW20831.1 uncharacterized protein DUF2779 [Breznakia blatticola]